MGADAKRKEARKRKFGIVATASLCNTAPTSENNAAVVYEPRKKRKESQEPSTKADARSPIAENEQAENATTLSNAASQGQDTAIEKTQRFIVFIGNLPYTATDESIGKHFAKIQPKSIRHRTKKENGKSKGFAFLEFDGYDRMKTCLKLYHGSSFDDGTSPARKLNVELTAGGGGGKSEDRRSKLRAKNERLNEQRSRRAQEEQKHKTKIKNEELHKDGKGQGRERERQSTQNGKEIEPALPTNNGDVHPSRRNRVAGSA